MGRKAVRKKKLNDKSKSKKSKPKNNINTSQNTTNSETNSSTTSELNYTLPEGNHLDSFDIFRSSEEQYVAIAHFLCENFV